MRARSILILVCGLSLTTLNVSAQAIPTLVPMDESTTALVSPDPVKPAFQYSFGTNPAVGLVTARPLLCANTAAPTGTAPTAIDATYYSAAGSIGPNYRPFVFGASATAPTVSALAYGATNVAYDGSRVQFGGDPLDALVCYGLDDNGVHKLTRSLFVDGFEEPGSDGLIGNSTVSVSVFHIPQSAGDYYGYTIDVTIPPLPTGTDCNALDCNFALREGFDSAVLNTAGGQWCLAPAGAQSCAAPPPPGGTSPKGGNINVDYSNFGTVVSLQAPIGAVPALHAHFVAYRYLAVGVNALPASGAPLVMAALFSPLDLLENKLDDNVATGNETLANLAPGVANDATFTTFSNSIKALQENTDSGSLTFNIADADTPESAGNLLHAAVMLNLPNGIQVPLTADCGTTTPITSVPVNRACTIDIPLDNATFWDAAVSAMYQGQFNNVATDTTNGIYANGVSANLQITVTDAQGKSSSLTNPMEVHIFSTKNDAPIVAFDAGLLPSLADPNDSGNLYPTYACSVTGGNCGATFFIAMLNNAVTAQPGPAAAFDELALQTTVANDLQCAADGGAVQTTFAFAPVISLNSGSQTGYDIAFQFSNPPLAGSVLCTITFADAQSGGFPNGEAVANPNSAPVFRIVVDP